MKLIIEETVGDNKLSYFVEGDFEECLVIIDELGYAKSNSIVVNTNVACYEDGIDQEVKKSIAEMIKNRPVI